MSTKARLSDRINKIDIAEHGLFSSDSIENKVMATMKMHFILQ